MSDLEEIEKLKQEADAVNYENVLKDYLEELHEESMPWKTEYRAGFGRCMIATRDIQTNDLIFVDKPVILGPRVNNYEKIFCVCCSKIMTKLILCKEKCKFPVCENCVYSEAHQKECKLIRSWKLKNQMRYSKHLFRALTIIRGLLLSEKHAKLIDMMECHQNTAIQNLEVEKILGEFETLTPDCDVVMRLKHISSILNTNAFEVSIVSDDKFENVISLRGLYPLAALMNHDCIPNIRYVYRHDKTMAVYAVKLIKKGEQIFNSYTKFLWGTNQRRVHLAYSKKFMCYCKRCKDPTEFSSYVSAIKCVKHGCNSMLLPINPTVIQSPWHCLQCDMKLDHLRVSKIQDIFSNQIFTKILNDSMTSINHYLKEKLLKIVPETNQFVIEVKLQIILKMKQDQNYQMTLEDYEDVQKYCYDVLDIVEKLGCGECFVKGLLYYELINAKLKTVEMSGQEINDDISKELKDLLQKSWTILGNCISEPQDLKKLMAKYT